MKSLFMLMLAFGFLSNVANATVGEKKEGAEDCTKVIQQTQNILKHNAEAADSSAPASTPVNSGTTGAQ